MNKPLWGRDMPRDIQVHLQEPEPVLTVLHAQAHEVLTPAGSQESDALAQVRAIATDPSVDTAYRAHRKSGHRNAQLGWHIAKDAQLPVKFGDLVTAVTACLLSSKQ